MALAAELATRAMVMQSGRIIADGEAAPRSHNRDLLASACLEPPALTRIFAELSRADGGKSSDIPMTIAEAKALPQWWTARRLNEPY
jgi:hypothetical protein